MSTELMLKELDEVSDTTIRDYLRITGLSDKLDDKQMMMFKNVAQALRLNPFKREIHPMPFFNKNRGKYDMSLCTGYEVYLKRAERTGLLDGWEPSISDDCKTATVIIHRKDRKIPFKWTVWYEEYSQDNHMWRGKKRVMLLKCAISTAFRLCFPEELGGMPYGAEEIGLDGVPKDVTPSPTPNTEETEKELHDRSEALFKKVYPDTSKVQQIKTGIITPRKKPEIALNLVELENRLKSCTTQDLLNRTWNRIKGLSGLTREDYAYIEGYYRKCFSYVSTPKSGDTTVINEEGDAQRISPAGVAADFAGIIGATEELPEADEEIGKTLQSETTCKQKKETEDKSSEQLKIAIEKMSRALTVGDLDVIVAEVTAGKQLVSDHIFALDDAYTQRKNIITAAGVIKKPRVVEDKTNYQKKINKLKSQYPKHYNIFQQWLETSLNPNSPIGIKYGLTPSDALAKRVKAADDILFYLEHEEVERPNFITPLMKELDERYQESIKLEEKKAFDNKEVEDESFNFGN